MEIILVCIIFAGISSTYGRVQSQINIPQELPDGLLVTGGEEIRSHTATWTVLVTLDAPQPEVGLQQSINYFKQIIEKVHNLRDPHNATRTAWTRRIEELETTMLQGGPKKWPTGPSGSVQLYRLNIEKAIWNCNRAGCRGMQEINNGT